MELADATAEQWRRIRELADQLLDLPPTEWTIAAAELLPENEELRLLALELARSFDDSPDLLGAKPFPKLGEPQTETVLAAGQRVGSYRIEKEIGRGGMGRVYLASRADGAYTRNVALKVIQVPGASAMERFRIERRILAGLDHANIAHLYDAGAMADGTLYFVMEYVDGLPLDLFCRGLHARETARIMQTVAGAIDFAHRNGVIHRDLKPANILVTESGIPKLLDFGIASLRDNPRSSADAGITPGFASPEQAAGEPATERSDVYSLGIILKAALSRAADTIPRDLKAVLLRATANDANSRYAGAGEFEADVARFLGGYPVAARPASHSYRAACFLKRNRHSAIVVAGLCTLTILGAAGYFVQRDRAERQMQAQAEIVRDVLAKEASMRSIPGTAEVRRGLVQDALHALQSVEPDSARNPDLACNLADAYLRVGLVLGMPSMPSLGDYSGAETNIHRSRILAEEIVRRWPGFTRGQSLLAEALVYEESIVGWRGNDAGCVELGVRAGKEYGRLGTRNAELTILQDRRQEMLARCETKLGRLDDAIRTAREWVARKEALSSNPADLMPANGRLARTLYEAGQLEEGRRAFDRSIGLVREVYRLNPSHENRRAFAQEIATAASARVNPCGDPADRKLLAESVELAKQYLKEDSKDVTPVLLVADTERCLATNLASNGEGPGALRLLEQSRRELNGVDLSVEPMRLRVAEAWYESGNAAVSLKDWRGALQYAGNTRHVLGEGKPESREGILMARSWWLTGLALEGLNQPARAADAWRRQLDLVRRYAAAIPGRNADLDVARALHSVGLRLARVDKTEGARDLREAAELFRRIPGASAEDLRQAQADWQKAAN